jgi:hypothetical protein
MAWIVGTEQSSPSSTVDAWTGVVATRETTCAAVACIRFTQTIGNHFGSTCSPPITCTTRLTSRLVCRSISVPPSCQSVATEILRGQPCCGQA